MRQVAALVKDFEGDLQSLRFWARTGWPLNVALADGTNHSAIVSFR